MADLESRLNDLGAKVEYPATPSIAARAGDRLREGTQAAPRPRRATRLRLTLATAVALLLLAASTAAAIPSARNSILEFLGLRGASIERIPEIPEMVQAKPSWRLGRATTLEAAAQKLSFSPLLPTGLGKPNGVFVSPEVPGNALTLTYPPRPGLPQSKFTGVGLLLNELNGNLAPGFVGKFVPRNARVQRFELDGHFAVWIEGLHVFIFKAADHIFHIGRSRLAANALLLQRGKAMIRLEAEFDKPTAIEIAESLRRCQTGCTPR